MYTDLTDRSTVLCRPKPCRTQESGAAVIPGKHFYNEPGLYFHGNALKPATLTLIIQLSFHAPEYIGMATGIVAVLLLIVIIVLMVVRRNRRKNGQEVPNNATYPNPICYNNQSKFVILNST